MFIRVLTYNIHKCIGGLDRRYRPERIRDVVVHYDPDILCLQEVDDATRRARGERQVDLLAEMLGYRYKTYFPNVRVRGGGEYGNAILCRHPLIDSQNIDLTIPPLKRRSVLHARFRIRIASSSHGVGTRTLHVYNLHLGLSGMERHRQLRRFMASHPFIHLDHRTPIIVAGDFNDLWGTLGNGFFAPNGFRSGRRRIATFPAYAPVRPLDAVYVRGDLDVTRIFRSKVDLSRHASDHLPLIADLELV